jgi:hypothetical protein
MWWEPATSSRLKGCHRASFKIVVSEETYDAFFNSPAGYRGQYALRESAGVAANRNLLNALMPKLLSAAGEDHSEELILLSLNGEQAKVWIVESDVEDQLGNPTTSIEYSTWEFNEHDSQGLRAPIGTRLEVKGAWVNPNGEIVENPNKRGRSTNIYRFGDSK